jgi:hypothetical protein
VTEITTSRVLALSGDDLQISKAFFGPIEGPPAGSDRGNGYPLQSKGRDIAGVSPNQRMTASFSGGSGFDSYGAL